MSEYVSFDDVWRNGHNLPILYRALAVAVVFQPGYSFLDFLEFRIWGLRTEGFRDFWR